MNDKFSIEGEVYNVLLFANESILLTEHHTIVWTQKDEYWIDVKVVARRASYGDDRDYVIGEDITSGLTPHWRDAQPLIEGFVKWDGCMQLSVENGIHCDGDEDVKRFSELFPVIFERACDMFKEVEKKEK